MSIINTIFFCFILKKLENVNILKNKESNVDFIQIIRFLYPIYLRYNITNKLFGNIYEEIDFEKGNDAILQEIIIFVFDLFNRIYLNKMFMHVWFHHIATICLMSSYYYYTINNLITTTIGIEILNIFNSADIMVLLPKILTNYNDKLAIYSGVIGVIFWFYTRVYLTHATYIDITNYSFNKENMSKSENNVISVLFFFLKSINILGIYYTFLVIKYYLKFLITDINAVSGSVQLSTFDIIKTYYNVLFENKNRKLDYNFNTNYTTIFGYSCRSLFYTFLKNFCEIKKENIVIAITPIQHTSFIKILSYFQTKYNYKIIELKFNENYTKLLEIPNEKIDLILVTHLWGKYIDTIEISKYLLKNNNTLLIEDTILGGLKKNEFNSCADVLFHSNGFDKRPPVGRGAYLKINNKINNLKMRIIDDITNYSEQTKIEEIKSLNNITLLHFIYNFEFTQILIKIYIYFSGKKVSKVTELIRKQIPGFEHNNFLKKPSKSMLKLCIENINKNTITEQIYSYKNELFYNKFSKKERDIYFPWHKDSINSVLTYTPILMNTQYHNSFLEYIDNMYLSVIKNPTYKCFETNNNDNDFIKKIIYLPNLYTLDDKKIDKLYIIIKKFIDNI